MSESPDRQACEDWWATSIIEMRPGVIRYRGYAIEDLIGRIGFPGMVWLMLRGELPSEGEAELLGTALMAAVDHGPQAPSIAIARMAATCGVGINNAMASAINVLGDVNGPRQLMRLLLPRAARVVAVSDALRDRVAQMAVKIAMEEQPNTRWLALLLGSGADAEIELVRQREVSAAEKEPMPREGHRGSTHPPHGPAGRDGTRTEGPSTPLERAGAGTVET